MISNKLNNFLFDVIKLKKKKTSFTRKRTKHCNKESVRERQDREIESRVTL